MVVVTGCVISRSSVAARPATMGIGTQLVETKRGSGRWGAVRQRPAPSGSRERRAHGLAQPSSGPLHERPGAAFARSAIRPATKWLVRARPTAAWFFALSRRKPRGPSRPVSTSHSSLDARLPRCAARPHAHPMDDSATPARRGRSSDELEREHRLRAENAAAAALDRLDGDVGAERSTRSSETPPETFSASRSTWTCWCAASAVRPAARGAPRKCSRRTRDVADEAHRRAARRSDLTGGAASAGACSDAASSGSRSPAISPACSRTPARSDGSAPPHGPRARGGPPALRGQGLPRQRPRANRRSHHLGPQGLARHDDARRGSAMGATPRTRCAPPSRRSSRSSSWGSCRSARSSTTSPCRTTSPRRSRGARP